jgi:hypothetical protein
MLGRLQRVKRLKPRTIKWRPHPQEKRNRYFRHAHSTCVKAFNSKPLVQSQETEENKEKLESNREILRALIVIEEGRMCPWARQKSCL